ncbi:Aste57867_10904 [Aphanomyces stellatus]|uniref:Aste57867_10904 protein n=1 Tax=Aphanomyces stellatus TaxID=120398 RepID=A0A485KS46_9STRA|nr:hypothetical protein As57867_010864 [Aphanomyces stellatus]VFT87772.1 Aste57867_10904 [Aphanomyces stellatus]
MLSVYVIVLSLSAGMTLCTCFSVFKWKNVTRDAGHGTMFMVFFCWFVWSIAMLGLTCTAFINDRSTSWEAPLARHLGFITETFFNSISLWFTAAAYELQRRALHPRSSTSHRASLTCYMLLIGGSSFVLLATLVVIDYTCGSIDPTDALQWSSVILSAISWGTWGIRAMSVLYPAALALWLARRRCDSRQGLPKALSHTVLLFFALNTPYLILGPLVALDVIPSATVATGLGLVKALSFGSGIAISVVLGLSIRGFDAFYHSTSRSQSSEEHLPPSNQRRIG